MPFTSFFREQGKGIKGHAMHMYASFQEAPLRRLCDAEELTPNRI